MSDPEIKVTDRRRFSAEGEPIEDTGEEQSAEPSTPAADSDAGRDEMRPLPPASFAVLVGSLRFQAELQLGLYAAPDESALEPDLEGARHTIDLLGVLQEKTRGNLSLEEQRLLDNSLTELRFRYVHAAERASKSTKT